MKARLPMQGPSAVTESQMAALKAQQLRYEVSRDKSATCTHTPCEGPGLEVASGCKFWKVIWNFPVHFRGLSPETRGLQLPTDQEKLTVQTPGKPVSLSYRCPCRFFESHVARANVKHLKILNTPNCALQIVAKLKNNNRQVCIDPKLKWIQEYLEKALNKADPGLRGARTLGEQRSAIAVAMLALPVVLTETLLVC
ncbi:Stromal cell-derived factor 1 [Myotis davidii]|uniref:Stromal cell-derived factor 1 n=1 Tax=Myotis davidii TaxID=225400 RepID=L5M112_MYODS|nr:Stromal cell-derived factor 1 [Myotis davidii]